MSLRLTLIHFICLVVFGVGVAALLWGGGHFVYAKTHQLYEMGKFRNPPDTTTGKADIPSSIPSSSHAPIRRRIPRQEFENQERENVESMLQAIDENPYGIVTGHLVAPLPSRLSERLHATPRRSTGGNFSDGIERDPFFPELQDLQVGDAIQLSTQRGTFGYFVTTIEISDPSAASILESSGHSELTIVTSRRFPFLGATPQQFVVHARRLNRVKN